ncbi:MAG: tRNA lysidine(34) synthetase TilS [Liquorilactobacillus sp.]|uniref:tRNA lysidine(34) synthetase TilS n=3 Tax=Liquorilactobacillus sp. TaxID=2767923 RepID=UPI0039EA4605
MENLAQSFFYNFRKYCPNQRVLVAVSTGVDSMVLLDLLSELPESVRPVIEVAYVDHKLRQESQAETSFIRNFCKKRHIKLHCREWETEIHPNVGIESAARTFRYKFFADIMEKTGIKTLLTAHHADDQAETFLMKLVRGGNIQQLQGIRVTRRFADGYLVRLLLNYSKDEIREYARKRDLIYFEDATNRSNDYLRNRVRHLLVPKMKDENSKFLEHVQSYEHQLSLLLCATEEQVDNYLVEMQINETAFSVDFWLSLSKSWRTLVIRKLLEKYSRKLNEDSLNQIESFLGNSQKPQGSIKIGMHEFLIKKYNLFYFDNKYQIKDEIQNKYRLKLDTWVFLNEKEEIGVFFNKKPEILATDQVFYFSDSQLLPLTIRHRNQGDRIHTKVGTQKLKKILIDDKIPQDIRAKIWIVVTTENLVLWVPSVKRSDLSESPVNDKMQYMIIFRNKV